MARSSPSPAAAPVNRRRTPPPTLPRLRFALVQAVFVVFATALSGRAGFVQIWRGRQWLATAQRQHFAQDTVRSPRGGFEDATGAPLVMSRERFRVELSPRALKRHAEAVARAMADAGVATPVVSRIRDTTRVWVVVPGLFDYAQVASLDGLPGVHMRSIPTRTAAPTPGLAPLLGHLNSAGLAVDGLEQELDSLLRGERGVVQVVRDGRGRVTGTLPDASAARDPGATVRLTIHQDLQQIVEQVLHAAVLEHSADGGDVVVLNVGTGEVLAMASERVSGPLSGSPVLLEPYEPGSSIKPFMAAALLRLGKAKPDDEIDTFNGEYTTHGRTIHDTHVVGRTTLAKVIEQSSNVGIVRFSERLTPREQYEGLRDFGFGSQTGIPYPIESGGRLREPRGWSAQSAASLAMGYEMSATPLQLAAAYAALANDGVLLRPTFIKSVRRADGSAVYTHRPDTVRQAVSVDVAAQVRAMLRSVVDSGTGKRADLALYSLAGKTATARRTSIGKGYVEAEYNSSFLGYFPAESPQISFCVRIVNSKDGYLAGAIAAPLIKTIIEASLATGGGVLDRGRLMSARDPEKVRRMDSLAAEARRHQATRDSLAKVARLAAQQAADNAALAAQSATPLVAPDSAHSVDSSSALSAPVSHDSLGAHPAGLVAQPLSALPPIPTSVLAPQRRVIAPDAIEHVGERAVFRLPYRPAPLSPGTPRRVPSIDGQSLRAAALALHRAGFRVVLSDGPLGSVSPQPGTVLPAGTTVHLGSGGP